MGYTGQKYTWSNHRKAPDTVRVRLDRACATAGWRTLFPSAQVVTEAARGLDHTPLLVALEVGVGHSRAQHRKMFKFEAMWTRLEEREAIIKNQWCNPVEGDIGFWIFQRTRQVRAGLIEWDREYFGLVRRWVKELEEQLAVVSKDPISEKNAGDMLTLRRELEEFLTREEIMWKQRGKAQ
ncbi:UNVERIFIED_CONTAM: hypothetical protein Slati_2690700 [Sesamum latifolium]|uniref:Uncharacterized protein n=1 Tax=Sesamum latifolium TaxID=2727402 RepID=A0AAW2VV85_9LAMI